MSWMTPAPGATRPAPAVFSAAIDRSRQLGHPAFVAEQLLDPVPALLHPGQRQPEPRNRVAHEVEHLVAADWHQQLASVAHRLKTTAGQFGSEQVGSLVDVDC